jgi:arsenate reductase-like glutaredoxin family protein
LQRRILNAHRDEDHDCTAIVKIKRNSVTRGFLPDKHAKIKESAMILYGIKTCDTCRKALKALGNVTFHDVRADGLPREVAQAAWVRFGDAIVNRQSTTWRALAEDERARDPLDLLAAHPTLMKRPLIDASGTLYLGWGKDTQAALLG